ncbi:hypothetical protein J2X61_003264 [Bacillus sp. 3255]|nr:hypothetical protein [Bacillus sp. 3255]
MKISLSLSSPPKAPVEPHFRLQGLPTYVSYHIIGLQKLFIVLYNFDKFYL